MITTWLFYVAHCITTWLFIEFGETIGTFELRYGGNQSDRQENDNLTKNISICQFWGWLFRGMTQRNNYITWCIHTWQLYLNQFSSIVISACRSVLYTTDNCLPSKWMMAGVFLIIYISLWGWVLISLEIIVQWNNMSIHKRKTNRCHKPALFKQSMLSCLM